MYIYIYTRIQTRTHSHTYSKQYRIISACIYYFGCVNDVASGW